MNQKVKKALLAAVFLLGVALCLYVSVLTGQVEATLDRYGVAGTAQAGAVTKAAARAGLELLQARADEPGVTGAMTLLRLFLWSDWVFWIGAAMAVTASLLIICVPGEKQRRKRFDAKRTALCGVLMSLMLILGWVERMIPMPHGIKLGLSNSVLIFAVYMLDIPTAYVLMIYKVFLSNLLFGNLGTTFMMGFAGGVTSLTAMVLISRIRGMHPVTVSIVGGVCHNVGQVLMAMQLMNNAALLSLLPWLMITGMGFGALTGVAATMTMKHLKKTNLVK